MHYSFSKISKASYVLLIDLYLDSILETFYVNWLILKTKHDEPGWHLDEKPSKSTRVVCKTGKLKNIPEDNV